MEKKGQVTAFILLGIILLIALGAYFGVKNYIEKQSFESQLRAGVQVPQQVEPAVQFLDECTKQEATNAITEIGLQGGYLNFPTDSIPTSPITPIPPAVEILSRSNLKTALWFRETGNGIRQTQVPTKEEIQKNIADLLTQQFPRCIDQVQTAYPDMNIQSLGDPKASVEIFDQLVNAKVTIPITISTKGITFTVDAFGAQIETEFGKLYQTAIDIFNKQNEVLFLENKTLDLLTAYDPEIPYSGVEPTCSPRTWSKADTTNRLKLVLFENIAAMKIKGTNYAPNDQLKSLEFDALKQDAKEITVNMLYSPKWPTFVDISPSEGDVLAGDPVNKQEGNELSGLLAPYFCFNQHHFIYTIKYPVTITLTDPQGFIFQYATEIIIEKNQPRRSTATPLDLPDTRLPICDYPQAPLKINTFTVDSQDHPQPLSGVNLNLKCSPTTCPLQQNAKDSSVTLTVPACVNGALEGTKTGYLPGKTFVSTNTDQQQEVNLVLEPKYTKPVEFYVIDKKTGEVRKPYASETIMYQLAHTQPTPLTSTIIYQQEGNDCQQDSDCGGGLACQKNKCLFPTCASNQDCSSDQSCTNSKCQPKNTVELAVGDYDIQYFVLRSSTWPIVMPKQEIQRCVNAAQSSFLGLLQTQEQCTTTETESSSLSSVMTGGATFKHAFTREELASDRPVKLYALVDDIPADQAGLTAITAAFENNKDHPYFKAPEI